MDALRLIGFSGEFPSALRGGCDVVVVGQDDHVLTLDGLGGREQHLDRGVVGCAAGDDRGCAELGEDAHETAALGDGDDGGVRLGLMSPCRLHTHVDGAEDADSTCLVGGRISVGRLSCVQVDAQVISVGSEHYGLIFTREHFAQGLDVVDVGDDELRAEAIELAVGVQAAGEPARVDCAQFRGHFGNRIAGERSGHAAQHELQTARACVDDAGVLEDRILLRCVFDGFVGSLDGSLHLGQRLASGGLDRRGRVCGDGDHRPVARFGDCIARGVGGAGERRRERCFIVVSEPGGEASQPLGSDDARTSAAAEQGCRGGCGGDFVCGGAFGDVFQGLACRRQGASQVCAGVAVRDREHVDQIQGLTMQRDPAGSAADHAFDVGAAQAVRDGRGSFPFDHL